MIVALILLFITYWVARYALAYIWVSIDEAIHGSDESRLVGHKATVQAALNQK